MKIVLLFTLFFPYLPANAQNKHSPGNFTASFYYSDGSTKDITTNNIDSLRNIKISLNDAIFLDSFKTFKKGKLQGPAAAFYSDGITVHEEYINNKLASIKSHDTNHLLLYSLPLDRKKITKTKFQLTSKRDYFDHTKEDTIRIFNTSIPPHNFNITSLGANIFKIDNYTYAIRILNPNDLAKEITISLYAITDIGTGKYQASFQTDVFIIPVR